MFRTQLAKVVLVSAALMLPASIATVAFTGGVAAAASDSAACSKLSGTVSGTSATGALTKCTDTAATDAKGTFSGSVSTTTGTIAWANGAKTTMTISYSIEGQGSCTSSNDDEIIVTGTVKKSTGKAKSSIKKGQPVSADICYNTSTNKLTLVPKTKFEV